MLAEPFARTFGWLLGTIILISLGFLMRRNSKKLAIAQRSRLFSTQFYHKEW